MPSWWEDLAAQADERAAFLNRFGLATAGGWGRPQEWQAGFYNPLQSSFEMGQQMAWAPSFVKRTNYEAPVDWGTFMGQEGQTPSTVADIQSRMALANLMNMTVSERAQAGLGFQGTTLLPDQPADKSVAAGEELSISYLQNLLQAALRSRFGRYGAAGIARMAGRMAPQWQAITAGAEAGGTSPASFLDYLRQRYGL